jgi:2-polyprenyl-3-methyl-5-hydroxy-6-metoxy-1,4-benzoquinol methylase
LSDASPTGRRWAREDALPLVTSKFGRILELAEGRDVLDVGCIGGPGERIEDTSHFRLEERARSCLGIDTQAAEIERWRAAGHEVVLADAETFQIGRRFDVVVAADLIEHLSNPGMFLQTAWKHLNPSGRLCLVTPNALSLNNALKSLAGVKVRVNPDHTCWFDRVTLRQLLARYRFRIIEEYWQDYQKHPLTAMACRLRKSLAAHIIAIAEPNEGGGPARS